MYPEAPSWPAATWPANGFGINTPLARTHELVKSLGGALFLPDIGSCWQDTGKTTPCTYDSKVASIADATGAFAATQGTTNSMPYLRSADYSPLPFTSATGEVWSTTRSIPYIGAAGGIERSSGVAYWRNTAGVAGQYASCPDSAAASVVGDCAQVYMLTPTSWASGAVQGIGSKLAGTTGEFSLSLTATGYLQAVWYAATVAQTATSTAPVPFTAGQTGYVRSRRAIGATMTFETSVDGITWAQLGSVVDISLLIAPSDSTNPVLIGSEFASSLPLAGKIQYAAIYSNANASGTPVLEFNPTRDTAPLASSWLDFDGIDDNLPTTITPGNHVAGFVCIGAAQLEALGGSNALFGTTGSVAVPGLRLSINAAAKVELVRCNGSSANYLSSVGVTTQNVRFLVDCDYSAPSARVRISGGSGNESLVSLNYAGTTQAALIGATNNAVSGVTPINYMQGMIFGLAWTPTVPSASQLSAIRRYVATRAGVAL